LVGVSDESRSGFPATISNPCLHRVEEWRLGRERFAWDVGVPGDGPCSEEGRARAWAGGHLWPVSRGVACSLPAQPLEQWGQMQRKELGRNPSSPISPSFLTPSSPFDFPAFSFLPPLFLTSPQCLAGLLPGITFSASAGPASSLTSSLTQRQLEPQPQTSSFGVFFVWEG